MWRCVEARFLAKKDGVRERTHLYNISYPYKVSGHWAVPCSQKKRVIDCTYRPIKPDPKHLSVLMSGFVDVIVRQSKNRKFFLLLSPMNPSHLFAGTLHGLSLECSIYRTRRLSESKSKAPLRTNRSPVCQPVRSTHTTTLV